MFVGESVAVQRPRLDIASGREAGDCSGLGLEIDAELPPVDVRANLRR